MAGKAPIPMRVSQRKNAKVKAQLALQEVHEVSQKHRQSVDWLDKLDAEVLRHRIVLATLCKIIVQRIPLRHRVREYFKRLWREGRIRPLTMEERFDAMKAVELDNFREMRCCEALAAWLQQYAHILEPKAPDGETPPQAS